VTLGLCIIMVKLPSEGLCSWSPEKLLRGPQEGPRQRWK